MTARCVGALAALLLVDACSPVDAGRPGCRDGSTYRPDVLPMLNGQCPTRADEGRAADYEIKSWDILCGASCAQHRAFTMLLNSPPRALVAAPAPPRLLPKPMAGR